MADYWKSQARKFCDFCKCWIADNKPSIQFHETGKRHKENVAQKLALLTRQSVKEKKESLKVDEEMKKMEEAAMKAYMKDMDSNPDFTSQVIKDKVEESKRKKQEEAERRLEKEEDEQKDEEEEVEEKGKKKKNRKKKQAPESDQSGVAQSSAEEAEPKLWYEAKSDEGYTYYWNYNSGESIWEPPAEGYLSIDEQANEAEEQAKEAGRAKVEDTVVSQDKDEKTKEEVQLKLEDEKDEKGGKEEEKEEEVEELPDMGIGPSAKPDPYGGWTQVKRRVEESVDWQLPQQDFIEIKVPAFTEPEIKFKEKKVTSLSDSDSGPSSFKKRKFGARGNVRQRLDDD